MALALCVALSFFSAHVGCLAGRMVFTDGFDIGGSQWDCGMVTTSVRFKFFDPGGFAGCSLACWMLSLDALPFDDDEMLFMFCLPLSSWSRSLSSRSLRGEGWFIDFIFLPYILFGLLPMPSLDALPFFDDDKMFLMFCLPLSSWSRSFSCSFRGEGWFIDFIFLSYVLFGLLP